MSPLCPKLWKKFVKNFILSPKSLWFNELQNFNIVSSNRFSSFPLKNKRHSYWATLPLFIPCLIFNGQQRNTMNKVD